MSTIPIASRFRILKMPGIELVRSFLQQASAQGSRSTALSPLGWLTAIIVSALVGLVAYHAETWVIISGVVALGLCVVMYLVAYVFFIFKKPGRPSF